MKAFPARLGPWGRSPSSERFDGPVLASPREMNVFLADWVNVRPR